ncbi:hypothetical protein [Pantoea sp. CTOTU49201]|uniref:hypothetical protein n=1 Tax=Pantoea sp. CTOTU49201 TaxID=2953855 RepID=UPI002898F926|nr:hypothetical protein [Pantoea sp. CTOTU49201]
MITSQINISPPVNIKASDELLIKKASIPPAYCKYFYVKNPIDNLSSLHQNDIYSQNTQAMIIADSIGIPTLNGFASFTPKDWVFKQAPSYLYKVDKYISNHNLNSVCVLDIKNNIWESNNQVDPLSDMAIFNLGDKITFSRGGNSGNFTASGWSIPESFGTWTDGDVSNLIMKIEKKSANPTLLIIEANAFLFEHKKDDFFVDIWINNYKIGTLIYSTLNGDNLQIKKIRIPTNSLNIKNGVIDIKFVMNPTISPYALGAGNDTRQLGLNVKSLTLQ